MIRITIFVICFCFLAGQSGLGQSTLMIQGKTPDLHLVHTISAKETWYSIGRLYNATPKEIASYNNTTIENALSIGQQLRIPLTAGNFSQNGLKEANEVFIPLYHTVQEKEWMYRISVNHNKVPIELLEKWNNISRDNAKAGTNLIVGFLKVKQEQSALAKKGAENVISSPPVQNEAVPAKKEEVIVKKEESKPTLEETKKSEITPDTKKPEIAPESKKPEAVTETKTVDNINFRGGYFKPHYMESGKETSGVSGIFKSTSGWNDGKYYALMNNVPVGTIVKVNFPSTNKSIYAKVLGQLPDMKESIGLAIRISDAAATELGAGHNKFSVDVKY